MLNTRQRPTVNVDLNDSESFLFFWKYLAAIGDSNVNAVDTFILSKGKLIRWYATDVDTRCVKRHPIDLSSLTNKEFVLLVKKILQSKKYLKVYKDKFRKSKIACVWYLTHSYSLTHSLTHSLTQVSGYSLNPEGSVCRRANAAWSHE